VNVPNFEYIPIQEFGQIQGFAFGAAINTPALSNITLFTVIPCVFKIAPIFQYPYSARWSHGLPTLPYRLAWVIESPIGGDVFATFLRPSQSPKK